MPIWMTASEISVRYAVGEERLLAYSRRGNLPFRRTDAGEVLFDERAVAQFFSSRIPAIFAAQVPKGPHLGLLGVVQVGIPRSQTATSPSARRALRFSSRDAPAPLARTGTDRGR